MKPWFYFVFVFFVVGCSDPSKPEFEYKENLVYIESLATTSPGGSYALITRSTIEFGVNKNIFVSDASLYFVNVDTGASVSLTLDNELYVPPIDFVVTEGETWILRVELSDGTRYESEAETTVGQVAIDDLETAYSQELFFSAEYDKFVSGAHNFDQFY